MLKAQTSINPKSFDFGRRGRILTGPQHHSKLQSRRTDKQVNRFEIGFEQLVADDF
jgi:hypothetical protein